MTVERGLNAGRKRRLLAAVDRALAKQGIKPPKSTAKPSRKTEARRQAAQHDARSAAQSYEALRVAVQALGGIRPNRDYGAGEIPRELRARAGRPGLAPDEAAQLLSSAGFHYSGDVELFRDINRRRDRRAETRSTAAKHRPHKNPTQICVDMVRDRRGRFVRKAA